MSQPASLKIAIASSPVAPLGLGPTGGVTRHIENTTKALHLLGHAATVFAPAGSRLGVEGVALVEVHGQLQPTLATGTPQHTYPIVADSVLGHMWHALFAGQAKYDIVMNFGHDWLPYYLTGLFKTPVGHVVNMGNVCAVTSHEIGAVARRTPERIAFLSRAQADDLGGLNHCFGLSFGLDLSLYRLGEGAGGYLVWAGRISPEKGLEDALAIAAGLGERLRVAGPIGDESYWQDLQTAFAETLDYQGNLDQPALQQMLGDGRAFVQTQKWSEALGIVTLEAMACGTPVVAYRRGANAELVDEGTTGFLVPADDLAAGRAAIERIGTIDRKRCRCHIGAQFSLDAYADRIARWLDLIFAQTKGEA